MAQIEAKFVSAGFADDAGEQHGGMQEVQILKFIGITPIPQ